MFTEHMMKQRWVHFVIFLLGFVLIFGGIVSGFAAVEYVIYHEESADDGGDVNGYGMVHYEEISPEHQQIVDGTIEGDRYTFDNDDNVAIAWGDGRVVSYDDHDVQYHVIPRETTVNWTSTPGLLALALGSGGVLLIIEAIRRHHFPHYRPFA